jgi:hypothetical protein
VAEVTREIQAGLTKPISVDEADAMLTLYEEQITAAHHAAEALRNRIANGERTIAASKTGKLEGLNEGAVERAEQIVAQLKLELRQHDAWLTAGLGMCLAWGAGQIVAKLSKDEGWKPPPNSVLRLVMPGLVNVAVDLTS